MRRIRWGIVGAGGIAGAFAQRTRKPDRRDPHLRIQREAFGQPGGPMRTRQSR